LRFRTRNADESGLCRLLGAGAHCNEKAENYESGDHRNLLLARPGRERRTGIVAVGLVGEFLKVCHISPPLLTQTEVIWQDSNQLPTY
jgi:hypothetical protein